MTGRQLGTLAFTLGVAFAWSTGCKEESVPAAPDAADNSDRPGTNVTADGGRPRASDAGPPLTPDAGDDQGVDLVTVEQLAAAGRYMSVYRFLREAMAFGADDPGFDLDGDGSLGILDLVAARCAAHDHSGGSFFPEMATGCPLELVGEELDAKFLAIEPFQESECQADSDCQGVSPGQARCVTSIGSCRCRPIGNSGLARCQPQFP